MFAFAADPMTATVAFPPWSRADVAMPTAWRFAKVVEGSEAQAAPRLEWLLRRNCSMSPARLFGVYLSLCTVSLVIALAFAWQGASPVLAFAGIELVLVGIALLVYARHASDHERITLAGDRLAVVHQRGGQVDERLFRAAWVRVEPLTSDRSLIELTGDGQSSRVGRYLRPELRQSLAQELRSALRAMPSSKKPSASDTK
jgi:uncharacterized membrane protein